MQGRYFKKFEALNSVFTIQTESIIRCNKIIGQNLATDEKVFYKENYVVAYMYQSDIDRIRKYAFENLKSNREYLKSLYDNSIKKFAIFDSKHNQWLEEIDEIKDEKALRLWIGSFIKVSMDTVSLAYFAELFTGYDEFWPEHLDLPKTDFDILMIPEELSFTKQFDYELSTLKLGKSKKTVKDLAIEYYWIRGNYAGVTPLTEDDVTSELDKITTEQAKSHFEDTLSYIPKVLKEKSKLLSNIRDDRKKEIIKAISSFIVLQDKRKSIVLKTNYIFLKAIKKLLDMYGIPEKEKKIIISSAYPFWFVEMDKYKLVEMSREAFRCFYLPFTGKILVGDEALKVYREEEKEENKHEKDLIKGKTAFMGVVTGKIRIVLTNADFDKFIEGEILVTSMTRPEFVPLIKKSAGIITDEGGITCHAAIVARELKKPCIIGTRNASSVLKDGDLVEVDANLGIVKIIKKNE